MLSNIPLPYEIDIKYNQPNNDIYKSARRVLRADIILLVLASSVLVDTIDKQMNNKALASASHMLSLLFLYEYIGQSAE